MRNETSLFKRSLAALLCFVMVLGMVPAMNLMPEAQAAETPAVDPDHITMPITIRDFAADGMLFEYNETGKSGVAYKGTTNPTIPVYRSKSFGQTGYNHSYAYVREYDQMDSNGDYFDIVDPETNEWWHVIFVNSDGSINRVYPKGTPTADPTIPEWGKVIYAYEGCNNYNYFAGITDSTKANYSFGTVVSDSSTAGAYINCTKHEAVYHQADTKGFGMLYTKDIDIKNGIYEWDNDGDITGSLVAWNDFSDAEAYGTLISGGTYDGFLQSQYPTANYPEGYGPFYFYSPYQWFGLWDNSGLGYANQMLYGGTIRTNLVQKELKDGKPLYSTPAVKWIAEYLQVALDADWQNADGSYNTFFVTGDKVADGETLAARIRTQIALHGDRMGTYEESYAKFFNNNGKAGDGLDHYSDIETWYDAAFYLLHSTWRDSAEDKTNPGNDGYGKLAPEYHSMHLVAKEVDGKTTYVFNSMYTDAVYNPETGEIYNTQITEYEQATRSNGNKAFADGNPQPVDRFDPLGKYGTGLHGTAQTLGYGIPSPDTYGDMIEPSTADWADYYDTTNYHLSLEGHAQFVYHEDADQYFTFTGDDDVYLYINNIRVLDIGGGHSIAKVGIRLNDVAAKIGLVDGQTYPFDFFYMERHGTAANFGIETNIQIADASMNTTKQGFQGGTNTGYGGPVDDKTHVGYTFELENNGSAHIYNLTFQDPAIGAYVGYDKIELDLSQNLYTLNDLYLIYWDKEGNMDYNAPGTFDEAKLKEYLAAGLEPGEKLGVYGFKYLIPANKWASDNTFTNTVYTTATNTQVIDNATQTLHGVADWKVVKMEVPYKAFHVYDTVHKIASNNPAHDTSWESPSVTVPFEKLAEYWQAQVDAGKVTWNQVNNATIVLCTAAGNEDAHNQRKNITTNGDDITYTSTTTGKDTVFFKFKGIDNEYNNLVFSYEVYTYGAADNIYVLDYGLSVDLAGKNFGYQVNDLLVNNHNNNSMRITASVVAGSNTSNYGDFTYSSAVEENGDTSIALKYTPKKIINGTDAIQVSVKIVETDANGNEKTLDKYTGVEMIQTITTAPASVVYYEENFANNKEGGITYVENGGNDWVQYETIKDGKPVAGIEQSADQNLNYGEDPNYKQDKEGQLIGGGHLGTEEDKLSLKLDETDLDKMSQESIDFLNKYLGYQGSDSNGTVKELVVRAEDDVMQFSFVGTGFEILSRTTDSAYAVLEVRVDKVTRDADGNASYTVFRGKPVITESIGGDLYQVPIIAFKNLPKGEYRVTVKAAASTSTKTRILFIDGIRIYGPLEDGEALQYYNPEEYHAEIFEVKTLVEKGKTIYADASNSGTHFKDEDTKLVYGTTMVEDDGKNFVLKSITNVYDYLEIGPNNELYLNSFASNSVIAFFLRPLAEDKNGNPFPEGARTLEIGAHRKADSEALQYSASAHLVYGSTAEKILYPVEDENFYPVSSGTEMYYTIDIDQLVYDEYNGGYLVMIGTNGTSFDPLENLDVENPPKDYLALTNIKVAGYEIVSVEEMAFPPADEEGDEEGGENGQEISTDSILYQPLMLMRAITDADEDNEEVMIPVNENLSIISAYFLSDAVIAGKAVTLSVRTNPEAAYVVITDANGNVFEPLKTSTKNSDGDLVFTLLWRAEGLRGDKFTYTIRVYDENDLASVNTKTVTLTIK